MAFETAFKFLLKLLTFKKGTLSMLSISISLPITYWFTVLTKGTDLKNLLIPAFLMVIGTMMFFIMCLFDLMTGLSAAKYKSLKKYKDPKKPYVKSYKLYRTLWKLLGVNLLSFFLMVSSMMIEILGLSWIYIISVSFQGAVWFLSCGFEIHSIGENHLSRYGYKPKIFQFWDNILNLFERKVANNVDSSLNIIEAEVELIKSNTHSHILEENEPLDDN